MAASLPSLLTVAQAKSAALRLVPCCQLHRLHPSARVKPLDLAPGCVLVLLPALVLVLALVLELELEVVAVQGAAVRVPATALACPGAPQPARREAASLTTAPALRSASGLLPVRTCGKTTPRQMSTAVGSTPMQVAMRCALFHRAWATTNSWKHHKI